MTNIYYAAVLSAVLIIPVHADIVDFEGLPATYMYLGGGQNIDTFYAGFSFGPNVTGLDLTGSTAFPPHSGSIAVWDPVDFAMTISFSSPLTMAGVWYTSLDLLTLDAFDPGNSLLGEIIGAANTDGTIGESDFLSVSAANIVSITLTGPPGGFVFDDLTFAPQTSSPVPEPSTACLVVTAIALTVVLRRRRIGA
jgi:hypothetical protein